MSRSARRSWTLVIFCSLGLAGAVEMVRGPVVPELGTTFGAPAWQLGLIAPAGTVGYLVVVSIVGFGAGHVRPRRLVAAGLAGNGVALLGFAAAPRLWVFLVAVALQGAMVGVVRALNRPILSHLYPSARGRVYSYYDMTWAVGATLGPVLFAVVTATLGWRAVFVVLAAGMGLLAVAAHRLPGTGVESEEEPFTRADVVALVRRPEVAGMVVVMFFATGVEGGLFLWLPTYAAGELPGWLSEVALSVMIAGYVPGRFAYGRLAERVGYVPIVVSVLALLVPVFALTFLVAEGVWLLPGVLAIGLLISGCFPMLVSWATEAVPEFSGPVTAIAAVAASLGIGVVPALMGGVISGADAGLGMRLLLVPLVAALVLVVGVRIAERRRADRALADGQG